MQGVTTPLGYDLAEAQFILSFGVWPPRGVARPGPRFAGLRPSPPRRGAPSWPVHPGRSPALGDRGQGGPVGSHRPGHRRHPRSRHRQCDDSRGALRPGVRGRAHASGFEDWTDARGRRHAGFKNLVLNEYGLLTVSAATGCSGQDHSRDRPRPRHDQARRRHRRAGSGVRPRRPPHADGHPQSQCPDREYRRPGRAPDPGGPAAGPASTGSTRTRRRSAALGQPRLDGAGRGEYLLASDAPQALPGRILAGTPYPINALFLFATNPLANHPAKEAFARAIEPDPLHRQLLALPRRVELPGRPDPPRPHLPRALAGRPSHPPGGLHAASAWPRPAAAPLHADPQHRRRRAPAREGAGRERRREPPVGEVRGPPLRGRARALRRPPRLRGLGPRGRVAAKDPRAPGLLDAGVRVLRRLLGRARPSAAPGGIPPGCRSAGKRCSGRRPGSSSSTRPASSVWWTRP